MENFLSIATLQYKSGNYIFLAKLCNHRILKVSSGYPKQKPHFLWSETGSYDPSIHSPFCLKLELNNYKFLQEWHILYEKSSRWQLFTRNCQSQLQLIPIEAILFSGYGIKNSKFQYPNPKNQISKHADSFIDILRPIWLNFKFGHW